MVFYDFNVGRFIENNLMTVLRVILNIPFHLNRSPRIRFEVEAGIYKSIRHRGKIAIMNPFFWVANHKKYVVPDHATSAFTTFPFTVL